MEFSFKDALRLHVEISSNGHNTVIYDDYGNPNIMVRVSKYDMGRLGLKEGTHPAFKLGKGREVSEIWVSKYLNTIGNGGVPISIQGALPAHSIALKDSRALCKKKGRGWHIINRPEYGAISMMHRKMQANTGLSIANAVSQSIAFVGDKHIDGYVWSHVTGRGSQGWFHDCSYDGIEDLDGNMWETVDGCYLQGRYGRAHIYGEDGEIQNRFYDEKYMDLGAGYDIMNGDINKQSTWSGMFWDDDTTTVNPAAFNGWFTVPFGNVGVKNDTIPYIDQLKAVGMLTTGFKDGSISIWRPTGDSKIFARCGNSFEVSRRESVFTAVYAFVETNTGTVSDGFRSVYIEY